MGGDAWAKLYQNEFKGTPQRAAPPPPTHPHELPGFYEPAAPPRPLAQTPPSPFGARIALALQVICGLALGAGLSQSVLCLLKNGSPNPIVTAVLVGVFGLLALAAKQKIPSAALMSTSGLLLVLKPFARPVVYEDGHVFGVTSETHLNYIIPGVILIVIAALIAMSIKKGDGPADKKLSYALFAGSFVIGLGLAAQPSALFGPTRRETLSQYRDRYDRMRETFKEIHAKLPPPGALKDDKIRRDLDPSPRFQAKSKLPPNTEVVSAAQLLDQSERPAFDLLVSEALTRCLAWTGDKNPMVSSALDESDSNFANELKKALNIRWLAVYRPVGRASSYGGSTSADDLELFVFDLQSKEQVAAVRTGPIENYSQGRDQLARALERATGGSFSF